MSIIGSEVAEASSITTHFIFPSRFAVPAGLGQDFSYLASPAFSTGLHR